MDARPFSLIGFVDWLGSTQGWAVFVCWLPFLVPLVCNELLLPIKKKKKKESIKSRKELHSLSNRSFDHSIRGLCWISLACGC